MPTQSLISRGADLRGKNLDGASLSYADLRGVRTGMRASWAAMLITSGLALSLGCGIAAGFAGRELKRLISSEEPLQRAVGIFVAATMTIFLILTMWRGLRVAAERVLPVVFGTAAVAAMIAISSGAGT